MIASLHGVVEGKGPDWAVVRVGGIGFQVFMPLPTLARLQLEQETHLHTYLQLRQDGMALYGFETLEELQLFQSLLTVSGVGPRIALSLLSTLSPDQLALAIASGDAEMLSRVSGVGKKTASRLILELKGKLVAVPALAGSEENAEVLAALTGLGYTLAEASRALASLPPGKELSLEAKIKLALQNLGAR